MWPDGCKQWYNPDAEGFPPRITRTGGQWRGIPRSAHDLTALRNFASRSGTVAAVFAASVQLSRGRGKGLAHLLYVVVDIKDERPRDRGPLFVSSILSTPECTLWLGAGVHLRVEIWVLHTRVCYVLLCQWKGDHILESLKRGNPTQALGGVIKILKHAQRWQSCFIKHEFTFYSFTHSHYEKKLKLL